MESLSEIAEYVKPGDGKYLIASGKGSRLWTNYNPPLEFESSSAGYEIALLRAETYFSFPNIDRSNNRLRYMLGHQVSGH